MAFTLPSLADHPDADLLAMIARNTADLDCATLAIRKGHDEAVRVVGRFCQEWTDTDNRIASTPARTIDGLLSKAANALHDHEPGKTFTGYRGTALSVARDLLALQREG